MTTELRDLLHKPSPSLSSLVKTWAANVDQAASYLVSRGIGQAAARGCLLGWVLDEAPGYERFVGCLSIPYLIGEQVVAIKFRRFDDGPKYDGPTGQRPRLFNAGVLATGGPLVALCEGELDAIKATQDLAIPAVATSGASHWEKHYPRCFADFDRVVVFADNDEPGLKHARRVAEQVEQADVLIPPQAGWDLTDWLNAEGVDAVRKAVGL